MEAAFQEELDCILSVYENEVDASHDGDTSHIICCTVNFSNLRYSIIIRFCVNLKEDSLEIEIKNAESAKIQMPEGIITAIKSNLLDLHNKESNNMPIFQCISFIYTELIDDDNLSLFHTIAFNNNPSNKCLQSKSKMEDQKEQKETKKQRKTIKKMKTKKRTKFKTKQPKEATNIPKAWWLTVGTRIEYKYKGKKWKNGAITQISNAFKSTNIIIKYWKKPSVQKQIELNKQTLSDYIKSKLIIQSNLKYPLWIHTHSPIWVLCTYYETYQPRYGNTPSIREINLWRSAKIMHYIDGKHVTIKFNDSPHNNMQNTQANIEFLDKQTYKMSVDQNFLSFYSSDKRFLIEPFSVYWNDYTSKYLKNAYSTNVLFNTYYEIIYDLLPAIPAQICSIIIDCLGFDAINLSPLSPLQAEYKLWSKWDKYNENWIGIEFAVNKEIRNVFGIEMDVNVSAFGQVYGLICSANTWGRNAQNMYFWDREYRQLIDNYSVEMAETDDWENSDYLRLFFYETVKNEESEDEEEEIKKCTRIHLKPGRSYRLGFAVKGDDLPVFYWRHGRNRGMYGQMRGAVHSAQFGFIRMSSSQMHYGNSLFQTRYFNRGWIPNFRLLIS